MNSDTPYPSHNADDENHDSESALDIFPIWPQTFQQMQADADGVHDPQLVFSEPSWDLGFQPLPPQSQSLIWQQIFLQDDANMVPTPSEFDMSGLSQDQPSPSQPPFSAEPEIFPIQEDDPLPFAASASPQGHVAEADPLADNLCPMCGRHFRRSQDRDRHIRTFLPHWVFCPFPCCPWRGDRQDNLKAHWNAAHASCGQALEQKHCKIYDPSLLVKSVVSRELTIETAAYTALLEVERRAQELGKIGIWTDWWGRPQKIFEH